MATLLYVQCARHAVRDAFIILVPILIEIVIDLLRTKTHTLVLITAKHI